MELVHAHGEQLTCVGEVGADMTRLYPGWGFSKLTCKIFVLVFLTTWVMFFLTVNSIGTPFWLPAFFKVIQILIKILNARINWENSIKKWFSHAPQN